MDAHDTLGVAPDATAEQLSKAYRRLARRLHPDAHPWCSPQERARYEAAMALVNDAYRQLLSPPEARGGASARRSCAGRKPGAGECRMCGHAPAEPLTFTYLEGLLFSRRSVALSSTLCRDCGRAVGRSHQDRTLRTGWWGPTLFATNLGVVFNNARNLRRARRIDEPARVPDVTARLRRPMPTGTPVVLRAGLWVLPLLIALAASIWLGAHAVGAAPTPAGRRFAPGSCLVGTHAVTAVPCSEPHDAEIVTAADRATGCPAATPFFINVGERVLCVKSQP